MRVANLKILVIDDDTELNSLLSSYLGQFNFEVITATLPSEGMKLLASGKPDLIVLDVMLPERNGFEVCQEIRKTSRVPIIMLTARGDLSDRVVGLELGADDYLAKPYEPRELVARIQSVLRRVQAPPPGAKTVLKSQELTVDLVKASAHFSGVDLELTTAEFAVLRRMMENPGKTISRDDITHAMRGGGQWDSMDRTVDMIVSRLRSKLKDDTKHPRFLKTMWGEGYRFVGDVN